MFLVEDPNFDEFIDKNLYLKKNLYLIFKKIIIIIEKNYIYIFFLHEKN
jgi:hypothetical protein